MPPFWPLLWQYFCANTFFSHGPIKMYIFLRPIRIFPTSTPCENMSFAGVLLSCSYNCVGHLNQKQMKYFKWYIHVDKIRKAGVRKQGLQPASLGTRWRQGDWCGHNRQVKRNLEPWILFENQKSLRLESPLKTEAFESDPQFDRGKSGRDLRTRCRQRLGEWWGGGDHNHIANVVNE